MTLGARAAIDPEAVLHSKLIINWGSNTSVTNSHLWAIMHRARKAGAKIITIDPFRSKTAEKVIFGFQYAQAQMLPLP